MKKLLLCVLLLSLGCDVPKPKPTPTAPTPQPSSMVTDVINLINAERTRRGLKALSPHPSLMKEADRYAALMASKNTLSHNLDGSLMNRVVRSGYNPYLVGENIAWNARSAASVVSMWMNSSGHRANILNGSFKDTGVGIRPNSKSELYFCQIFASQR